MTPPERPARWHNTDVDWNRWPVRTYLAENYEDLHVSDDAVIAYHSDYYRQLDPDSLDRTVELGAGPNLYPLLLAAGAARHIDAVDLSATGLDYLRRQLRHRPDPIWQQYWRRCRALNPTLPATLELALTRVHVLRGNAFALAGADYALASMHFVAESATEDIAEFQRFCAMFAGTVRPGGHLVATFMENMGRYRLGDGSQWPGIPVDADTIREVFTPLTDGLQVARIDADPELPDYGYTGMVMLNARAGPGRR